MNFPLFSDDPDLLNAGPRRQISELQGELENDNYERRHPKFPNKLGGKDLKSGD